MITQLANMTYLVHDYDEAIDFFVDVLGFELLEDTSLDNQQTGKRWVRVGAGGPGGTALLLAKAVGQAQQNAVGQQAGGRVFGFIYCNDFQCDHAALMARGVTFLEQPRHEPYGTVVVFEDLYGNRWDLIQPD